MRPGLARPPACEGLAMYAHGARCQNFASAVTRIRTPAPTASIKHHHPGRAGRLAAVTAQTENHSKPPPRYIDHDGPQIVGLPDTPVRGAAMTSPDARADESPRARAQVEVEEVTPESAPTGPLTGDPTGLASRAPSWARWRSASRWSASCPPGPS